MTKIVSAHLVPEQPRERDRGRAIGAILVGQGRLTHQDVDRVQEYALEHKIRFGDAALQMKMLTAIDIENAIAQQFKYPVFRFGGEHGIAKEIVAAYQPQSPLIEPLRSLRSQLNMRWDKGKEGKVLAVTSPSRADGRSWLCANLAVVFAQLGDRVLLLDGDLRNPKQHTLFNLDNMSGLSSLLTGRAGREVVSRIHTDLRLFVLPAGLAPPNPQELLGREVFDLVLNTLSGEYDLIIIDTPAAAESADFLLLASCADAALMLARRNHTRMDEFKTAMQNLSEAGVRVIGNVVNEH